MAHQWFYSSKGGQAGPVGDAELAKLVAAGVVGPADLVWRDGLADWIPASKVRGLFAETGTEAPAVPQPVATASPVAPVPAAQLIVDSGGGLPETDALAAAAALASAPAPNVLAYVGGGSAGPEAGVTPRVVELLVATRPWVLLFAILMFVGAALMALAGVGMLIFGMMSGMGSRGGGPGTFGLVGGLIYVAMALLFFVPALYLSRFASRIATLRATGNVNDLESALDANRAYWKFFGILTCIIFGIYVVIFVMAILSATL